ncbi:hypothetical protein [Segetibacter koreensis]|nr:hypothetical protein [Segetibacter koreensis]
MDYQNKDLCSTTSSVPKAGRLDHSYASFLPFPSGLSFVVRMVYTGQ